MQTRKSLLSELDRRRQAMPLGVDPRTRLLFRVAAQRQTAPTEWAVEEVDVDAVERSGQRRVLLGCHRASIVNCDAVEAVGLRIVLPPVSDSLSILHMLGF